MTSKAAFSVEHLRGTQGIRKRPSMYIGGIDRAGMGYAVGEAISNSVDQFLLGHATLIRVDIAELCRLPTTVSACRLTSLRQIPGCRSRRGT